MIDRIILVTASKGGGGKTPTALSIALALNDLGIPVLAADFNFNNHDLLTILHGTNIKIRQEEDLMRPVEIGSDTFWRMKRNFWLTQWNSIMELGLPSISSFWNKIRMLSRTEFPDMEPKVMVIDSNLTLPLLCPPLTEIDSFRDLPPVEVFHLWSPSITLQLNEQDRFVKAINLLNRFNPGFEERLTHVFTPRHYAANSLFGTLASITKGEFAVTKQIKYKQSTPRPIRFSEIKDSLFASFIPNVLHYDESSGSTIQKILQQWLERIIEKLKMREYLTNNVIIVPTVVHKIALLVEELTLKPGRTLDTCRADLGSLYNIILDHFMSYRQEILSEYKYARE
ncbi:MAG: hypothetical protein INQ03_05350 [Candidatus Heimdallarchaeota archaeon]|nr:hypothetical protein [Candidatus Heimdallarchaeota archaeon]